MLKSELFKSNTIIIGDFNQRIPRKYSSVEVYNKLLRTFANHKLITEGNIDKINKQTIDHIFCSHNIVKQGLYGVSNINNGLKLSDHFGIFASLEKINK